MAKFLGINIHSGDTTLNIEEIRRKTIEKWSQLGLLDDVSNGTKENIARLLEGQASHIVSETSTQESGGFETLLFPVVRRVYATPQHDITHDFWEKIGFLPTNKIKKHKL